MRAITLAVLSSAVVQQSIPPAAADIRLPPVALQAADAGAPALAYILARAGVMAGIVTRQNPSDFAFVRSATGLDAPGTIPLQDVLARLAEKHGEYRAVWRNNILSLSPEGATCASAVRETMVGPTEYSGDAARVVVLLTWMVRGRNGTPRGMTGSVLGSAADLKQSVTPIKYALTATVSMESALNQVVQIARGGVWFAWEHTRSDNRVGCRTVVYWPNGLVSAPEEDFFVQGSGLYGNPNP